MATFHPFKGIRATQDKMHLVASRSFLSYSEVELYDKLNGNPFTFLHIIQPTQKRDVPELEKFLEVREKFDAFVQDGILIQEQTPSFYLYRQIKAGKKPRCPVEKYAFRMKFENTIDGGQVMSLDTGRVVFTVKDGTITSQDKGPLILSSAKDQKCYAKRDSGAWTIEGNANLSGGRFPYTVRGTDDGETLNLVLAQQGVWRVCREHRGQA